MVVKQTNVPIITSIEVTSDTKASGSMPSRNTKKDRTTPAKILHQEKVEDHPRNNKLDLIKKNHVDSSIIYTCIVIKSNSNTMCKTGNECLISGNHDDCVVSFLMSSQRSPIKNVRKSKLSKQIWNATGKIFANFGYQWRPTGRKFTLGNQCPLTIMKNHKAVIVKE